MTTKQEVDLDIYQKAPRILSEPMEIALRLGGDLYPILVAVAGDDRLRLDIRDRRFNVYYGGGNLMLVDASPLGNCTSTRNTSRMEPSCLLLCPRNSRLWTTPAPGSKPFRN